MYIAHRRAQRALILDWHDKASAVCRQFECEALQAALCRVAFTHLNMKGEYVTNACGSEWKWLMFLLPVVARHRMDGVAGQGWFLCQARQGDSSSHQHSLACCHLLMPWVQVMGLILSVMLLQLWEALSSKRLSCPEGFRLTGLDCRPTCDGARVWGS